MTKHDRLTVTFLRVKKEKKNWKFDEEKNSKGSGT